MSGRECLQHTITHKAAINTGENTKHQTAGIKIQCVISAIRSSISPKCTEARTSNKHGIHIQPQPRCEMSLHNELQVSRKADENTTCTTFVVRAVSNTQPTEVTVKLDGGSLEMEVDTDATN